MPKLLHHVLMVLGRRPIPRRGRGLLPEQTRNRHKPNRELHSHTPSRIPPSAPPARNAAAPSRGTSVQPPSRNTITAIPPQAHAHKSQRLSPRLRASAFPPWKNAPGETKSLLEPQHIAGSSRIARNTARAAANTAASRIVIAGITMTRHSVALPHKSSVAITAPKPTRAPTPPPPPSATIVSTSLATAPGNVEWLRAGRDPYPDLAPALQHRIIQNAVKSDSREQQPPPRRRAQASPATAPARCPLD